MPSVGLGREHGRVSDDYLEAVARKVQIGDEAWMQVADAVRARVEAKTGEDLLRRRPSSEDFPLLEERHGKAAPGQIRRRHERVVPATHDDGVWAAAHRRVSFRTSRAASRPGAPQIPPPGWLPDPHWYRLRTGVR